MTHRIDSAISIVRAYSSSLYSEGLMPNRLSSKAIGSAVVPRYTLPDYEVVCSNDAGYWAFSSYFLYFVIYLIRRVLKRAV